LRRGAVDRDRDAAFGEVFGGGCFFAGTFAGAFAAPFFGGDFGLAFAALFFGGDFGLAFAALFFGGDFGLALAATGFLGFLASMVPVNDGDLGGASSATVTRSSPKGCPGPPRAC